MWVRPLHQTQSETTHAQTVCVFLFILSPFFLLCQFLPLIRRLLFQSLLLPQSPFLPPVTDQWHLPGSQPPQRINTLIHTHKHIWTEIQTYVHKYIRSNRSIYSRRAYTKKMHSFKSKPVEKHYQTHARCKNTQFKKKQNKSKKQNKNPSPWNLN